MPKPLRAVQLKVYMARIDAAQEQLAQAQRELDMALKSEARIHSGLKYKFTDSGVDAVFEGLRFVGFYVNGEAVPSTVQIPYTHYLNHPIRRMQTVDLGDALKLEDMFDGFRHVTKVVTGYRQRKLNRLFALQRKGGNEKVPSYFAWTSEKDPASKLARIMLALHQIEGVNVIPAVACDNTTETVTCTIRVSMDSGSVAIIKSDKTTAISVAKAPPMPLQSRPLREAPVEQVELTRQDAEVFSDNSETSDGSRFTCDTCRFGRQPTESSQSSAQTQDDVGAELPAAAAGGEGEGLFLDPDATQKQPADLQCEDRGFVTLEDFMSTNARAAEAVHRLLPASFWEHQKYPPELRQASDVDLARSLSGQTFSHDLFSYLNHGEVPINQGSELREDEPIPGVDFEIPRPEAPQIEGSKWSDEQPADPEPAVVVSTTGDLNPHRQAPKKFKITKGSVPAAFRHEMALRAQSLLNRPSKMARFKKWVLSTLPASFASSNEHRVINDAVATTVLSRIELGRGAIAKAHAVVRGVSEKAAAVASVGLVAAHTAITAVTDKLQETAMVASVTMCLQALLNCPDDSRLSSAKRLESALRYLAVCEHVFVKENSVSVAAQEANALLIRFAIAAAYTTGARTTHRSMFIQAIGSPINAVVNKEVAVVVKGVSAILFAGPGESLQTWVQFMTSTEAATYAFRKAIQMYKRHLRAQGGGFDGNLSPTDQLRWQLLKSLLALCDINVNMRIDERTGNEEFSVVEYGTDSAKVALMHSLSGHQLYLLRKAARALGVDMVSKLTEAYLPGKQHFEHNLALLEAVCKRRGLIDDSGNVCEENIEHYRVHGRNARYELVDGAHVFTGYNVLPDVGPVSSQKYYATYAGTICLLTAAYALYKPLLCCEQVFELQARTSCPADAAKSVVTAVGPKTMTGGFTGQMQIAMNEKPSRVLVLPLDLVATHAKSTAELHEEVSGAFAKGLISVKNHAGSLAINSAMFHELFVCHRKWNPSDKTHLCGYIIVHLNDYGHQAMRQKNYEFERFTVCSSLSSSSLTAILANGAITEASRPTADRVTCNVHDGIVVSNLDTVPGHCGSPYIQGIGEVVAIHVGRIGTVGPSLGLQFVKMTKDFMDQSRILPVINNQGVVEKVAVKEDSKNPSGLSTIDASIKKHNEAVERLLKLGVMECVKAPRGKEKTTVFPILGYVNFRSSASVLNDLHKAAHKHKSDASAVAAWASRASQLAQLYRKSVEDNGGVFHDLWSEGYKLTEIMGLINTGGSAKGFLFDLLEDRPNKAIAKLAKINELTTRQLALYLSAPSRNFTEEERQSAITAINEYGDRTRSAWVAKPSLVRQKVTQKQEPTKTAKFEEGLSRAIISQSFLFWLFAGSCAVEWKSGGATVVGTIDRFFSALQADKRPCTLTCGCSAKAVHQKLRSMRGCSKEYKDYRLAAADFSGWDRTVPRSVMKAVLGRFLPDWALPLVDGCMGDGEYQIGQSVWRYRKKVDLWPSGNLFTYLANCIANHALQEPLIDGWERFREGKSIRAFFCGDDVVIATKKTEQEIRDHFASCGMQMKYLDWDDNCSFISLSVKESELVKSVDYLTMCRRALAREGATNDPHIIQFIRNCYQLQPAAFTQEYKDLFVKMTHIPIDGTLAGDQYKKFLEDSKGIKENPIDFLEAVDEVCVRPAVLQHPDRGLKLQLHGSGKKRNGYGSKASGEDDSRQEERQARAEIDFEAEEYGEALAAGDDHEAAKHKAKLSRKIDEFQERFQR